MRFGELNCTTIMRVVACSPSKQKYLIIPKPKEDITEKYLLETSRHSQHAKLVSINFQLILKLFNHFTG